MWRSHPTTRAFGARPGCSAQIMVTLVIRSHCFVVVVVVVVVASVVDNDDDDLLLP